MYIRINALRTSPFLTKSIHRAWCRSQLQERILPKGREIGITNLVYESLESTEGLLHFRACRYESLATLFNAIKASTSPQFCVTRNSTFLNSPRATRNSTFLNTRRVFSSVEDLYGFFGSISRRCSSFKISRAKDD